MGATVVQIWVIPVIGLLVLMIIVVVIEALRQPCRGGAADSAPGSLSAGIITPSLVF